MRHYEYKPPEELRDSIQEFWYTIIDFGEQPSDFEVLPDGYAEIVFLFGSACSVSTPEGLQPLPSPFLMGLLGQPVILKAQGRLQVLGVRCFPWTVFDLLGLPAGNESVRVFTHPIAQLQPVLAALMAADRADDALALLKQYFLEHKKHKADPMLHKAGAALNNANGTIPVSEVAEAAHATVRTLERKFKQAAGHTVKDVSGVMRFEQVRNRLWLTPAVNLATLAAELGYTDQAHLSREFKRYSGTTPAAFARKAKSGNSAVANFVAFVQD
ncbi:AraC family transcriptional regulator [Mucilaginibacter terrenus]|uniref:AraC family transcriptional regulator n=2 Tax=Mucilaginibacter terrenus TaxID=2482727 RepID=A0A3E2NYC1_9SPHI|nr:AraC family transcriptional regulator [Mucilaginibacter terrenus]